MNIATEIEKLVSLKSKGLISEEEFQKAKNLLMSAEVPPEKELDESESDLKAHIGMAVGIFLGNFLYHLILNRDPTRGFIVGAVATFFVVSITWAIRALRKSSK